MRRKIFVRENVVLVHGGECHQEAATKQGQEKCIRWLLGYEGTAQILAWLDWIAQDIDRGLIDEARRLVEMVRQGLDR